MMNLKVLHQQVKEMISAINYEEIWSGFYPGKFALYTGETCCFDGEYIEKPVDFCANTALKYGEEYIAIWDVTEELPLPVLVAKIVHELFHAFQLKNWEECWSNEMEALFQYEYREDNLSLKRRENNLLIALFSNFEQEKWEEFQALRCYRKDSFSYETQYERCVEEIEGIKLLQDSENYFPVRFSCYYAGALLVMAWKNASRRLCGQQHTMFAMEKTVPVKAESIARYQREGGIGMVLQEYQQETEKMITSTVSKNEILLEGPVKLRSVNVFDARRQGDYVTSRFFLMYQVGEEDHVIKENVVIKMRDEKIIDRVYRMV
ncbi:hypothetical protein SAMN02910358_01418 [Lachnospiraceae bacterium XBB1006]|nr:hypothetical protein SAMN02910358_01418 [Lachnospiraceae bacterium XBB1006]